ncbi:MAG: hypothetical protein J0H01_00725 [Rhizobiales bacterium]|nr:hypothetical protein [Hyphomicrobiales bacterium]
MTNGTPSIPVSPLPLDMAERDAERRLAVAAEQEDFVASNAASIDECPCCVPLAIHAPRHHPRDDLMRAPGRLPDETGWAPGTPGSAAGADAGAIRRDRGRSGRQFDRRISS